MQVITIDENSADQRVDRFLKKFFPKAPLGFIFKSIRTNKIKLNGKKPKPETLLQTGDELKLFFTDEQLDFTQKEPVKIQDIFGTKFYKQNLEIVYEDDDLLVLNKPAGVAVHPGTKNYTGRTLLDVADAYTKHKKDGSTATLVHRLDKDTSGLIIFAKNAFVLRKMNEMIREHSIKKQYLTLINGHLKKKKGTLKIALERTDGKKRSTKIIPSHSKEAKESITHYQVKQEFNDFSLLQVELKTGRMHQIRVHFATIGHPLIGDKNYGDFKLNREIQKKYGLKRHFLHAYSLNFLHPRTGKSIALTSDLSSDLSKLLKKI